MEGRCRRGGHPRESGRGVCAALTEGGRRPLGVAFEAVVDAMPPGEERRALIADLAAARPDLVLHRAGEWVPHDDVDVLHRLPEPWLRLAGAGAVRPWGADAVEEMRRRLGGAASETDTLASVMADRYPTLTRPRGLRDEPDRRWWSSAPSRGGGRCGVATMAATPWRWWCRAATPTSS